MDDTQPFYCFDLDGTVLQGEVLPELAAEVGLEDEMRLLTALTMQGLVPFDVSFRLRCRLLREIPLDRAQAIVASVPLDPVIAAFIRSRPHRCAIVTNNLDVWVRHRISELGCAAFTSEGFVMNGALVEVASILDKALAIDDVRAWGYELVVAIGDGANDVAMFERADVGVGFAGMHTLAPELVAAADLVVETGPELVEVLDRVSAFAAN